MKKIFANLLLALSCIVLVACGEQTPTAVKTNAVLPPTATLKSINSTTLAPTTSAAITGSPTFTSLAAQTQAGALTIPADGNFIGALETFKKVFEATGKAKSYKFTVQASTINLNGIFIKPDRLAGNLETEGQKAQVVLIDKDFYFSVDEKSWQKGASDTVITELTARLNEVIPANLAGSTYIPSADDKLDGKVVGVFSIETGNTGTLPGAAINKTRLTYKYDKQTFQVLQVQVKSGNGEAEIRYSDYDNPVHKVEAPV